MKLMIKEIAKRLPQIGATDGKDAIVQVKYFDPCGSWTWYATEYDPETGRMFGLVKGFETELGYFNLNELAQVKNRMGLRLERDLYFTPCKLSEVK